MKTIVKSFFILLTLIGFIGFIGGAIIAIGVIDIEKELPLSNVTSINLDKEENIYLGLESYGYIQKYSPKGRFIKNWRIKMAQGGKGFNVVLNKEKIYAIAPGKKPVEIFNLDGKKEKNNETFIQYDFNRRNTTLKKTNGQEYKLEGFFNRKLILTNTSGDEETIIKMNFINKLLRTPNPAWLIAVIGILGYSLFAGLSPRQQK